MNDAEKLEVLEAMRERCLEIIKDRSSTASELSTARQFLKDNDITFDAVDARTRLGESKGRFEGLNLGSLADDPAYNPSQKKH